MELKDYYKLLEISPTASQTELKRSFRRLAHLHHPDKNGGKPSAEAYFRELKEAYIVLSDPVRRERYNYERWSLRKSGKKFTSPVFSAKDVLTECLVLKEYIATVDIFRMNREALNQQLLQVLSEHNLSILKKERDGLINGQIINALLSSARPLPLSQAKPVVDRLAELAADDGESLGKLGQYIRQKRLGAKWDKYKIGLISIITMLLCFLIYFLGKR
jgi:molecular chaperone DnaJ